MKKIVTAMLILVMTFSCISLPYAYDKDMANTTEDIVISGSAVLLGENVKPLEASVQGANEEWEYSVNIDGIYIYKYLGREENVEIPSSIEGVSVVQIGGNGKVFGDIPVKTLFLPGTVKRIESSGATGAFQDCISLSEVTLPEGLEKLDYNTFCNCTSLVNITIPSSVISYDGYIFNNCTSLTDVIINSGAGISSGMFEDCTSLQNVVFNKSVSSIGSSAFKGCGSLKNIEFKEGLTTIEGEAFYDSGLKSLSTPSTLKTIGSYAFYECSALQSASLNDGITAIGDAAFRNCTALGAVNIPNSLTRINNQVFYNCKTIKSIAMGSNVETIGEYAFYGCTGVYELKFNDVLTQIEEGAFEECTSLKSVELPDSLINIENDYYNYNGAFASCTSLADIKINNGLINIGRGAFYNTAVKSIDIPATVKSIDDGAFENCRYLQSVTINGNIVQINDELFQNCILLTNVDIPETVISIGNNSFRNCQSLQSFSTGRNVTSIGEYAFCDCTGLYNIQLNEGLQAIYHGAFENVPAESIIIPSTVTQIDGAAFYNSNIIKAVFKGKQPNSFGENVFYNYIYERPETTVFYADSTGWTEGTYNGYKCYPYPAVNEVIEIEDCDRQGFIMNINGTDVACTKGTVTVWSNAGGRDDAEEIPVSIEYDPVKHISYIAPINIDTSKHNDETGLYTVEFCYGTESRKTDVVRSISVNVPIVSNKVEFEIPDSSVITGGTVRIPVKITNNPGFSTFGIIVNYDSSLLTPVSVENGNVWGSNFAGNPDYAPGQVSLNGMDIKNVTATGDFCYITFKVNDNVSENIKTELTITVNELFRFNENYDSLPARSILTSGDVDIQNVVEGDINFDGVITAMDATQALLGASGIRYLEGTTFEAADTNGDGIITAIDATNILLMASGLRK